MISGSGRRRIDAAPPRKVVAAQTKRPPEGDRLDSGEPGARCKPSKPASAPTDLNQMYVCLTGPPASANAGLYRLSPAAAHQDQKTDPPSSPGGSLAAACVT